jgi:hypothetical protein
MNASSNPTRRCLLGALALCALALFAGCGELDKESDITPQEIDAAKDIRVVFRNLKPQLSAHVSMQFVRDGRLCIDGEVLNTSAMPVSTVILRVYAYDSLDRSVPVDTPDVFTVPQRLEPGVSGHFSINIDPTDVAVVAIESAD